MASGSPKESEDLGMETIRGKPELVRNTRPALLLQPHSPDPSGNQVGGKWASQTHGCWAARGLRQGLQPMGRRAGPSAPWPLTLGYGSARVDTARTDGRLAARTACVCASSRTRLHTQWGGKRSLGGPPGASGSPQTSQETPEEEGGFETHFTEREGASEAVVVSR